MPWRSGTRLRARGNSRSSSACLPCYPPRKVNGISVGCFLTPDTTRNVFTHPAEIGREITELVGPYPVDVKNFRTHDKAWLKDEIHAMSRKHFAVVRHLIRTAEWDYLQFVEIGLDRLQHGFWKYHDPEHVLHEPDSPYSDVIRDYYRYLDDEIGSLLELLNDDTLVLVVSDHGARQAGRRLLRQRVADPRGAPRAQPLPRGDHSVRQAGRELGPDPGLERGGLLRPRLLQRARARASRA